MPTFQAGRLSEGFLKKPRNRVARLQAVLYEAQSPISDPPYNNELGGGRGLDCLSHRLGCRNCYVPSDCVCLSRSS
jgi:hypothetical protein